MRSRMGLFVGVLVFVLFAAVIAVFAWPPSPKTVTISVTATSGTKITGNYAVDGVTSQVDTEAPTEFKLTGREVTFAIHKDDQPGEMSVRIAAEDGWASATAGPNRGVKVGFRSGNRITRAESFWATNLQEEE